MERLKWADPMYTPHHDTILLAKKVILVHTYKLTIGKTAQY
jgi:hypothetical protein